MITFNIWLEARDDFEDTKATVLSALFPTLDKKQAEDNMLIPMDALDNDLINRMLENGNIIEKLANRDAKQFLKSKKGITVWDFVQWLINPD